MRDDPDRVRALAAANLARLEAIDDSTRPYVEVWRELHAGKTVDVLLNSLTP